MTQARAPARSERPGPCTRHVTSGVVVGERDRVAAIEGGFVVGHVDRVQARSASRPLGSGTGRESHAPARRETCSVLLPGSGTGISIEENLRLQKNPRSPVDPRIIEYETGTYQHCPACGGRDLWVAGRLVLPCSGCRSRVSSRLLQPQNARGAGADWPRADLLLCRRNGRAIQGDNRWQ